MNCKPGEVARVIACWETNLLELTDKIIRVTDSYIRDDGHAMWHYEGPEIQTRFGSVVGFADVLLRPISGGETPEQSTEAMRKLHETTVKPKAPVVQPFEWEKL